MAKRAEPDKFHIAALEKIIGRLEHNLRDLRIFRRELTDTVQDKGVLGSRGLTEFVLGLIKQEGRNVTDLLLMAEDAGYAIPTKADLSKRLVIRAYRNGDIGYDRTLKVWVWKGKR